MSLLNSFYIAPGFDNAVRELGLNPENVFSDRRIATWRSIPERENCTLDAVLSDGRKIRWHIKRYHAEVARAASPADAEAKGLRELDAAQIPSIQLVASGNLPDGRSFIITEDLAGYEPADKLVERGLAFEKISRRIADLAAKLHQSNLHHRDLYLCHFFVRRDPLDVRVIDAARVKRLPLWPLNHRWIVKDLAQLWYSMGQVGVSEGEKAGLLHMYAAARKVKSERWLRRWIEMKCASIARHDVRLRQAQPNRNISIPE